LEKLERVKAHMEKFDRRAPVEEILQDYEDDAVLEAGTTKLTGKQSIAGFFEQAFSAVGDQKFSDVTYQEREDGSIEVSWKLGPMPGGDRFYFSDRGLFARQKAYMGPRPADF
jgi:hypothetical protein